MHAHIAIALEVVLDTLDVAQGHPGAGAADAEQRGAAAVGAAPGDRDGGALRVHRRGCLRLRCARRLGGPGAPRRHEREWGPAHCLGGLEHRRAGPGFGLGRRLHRAGGWLPADGWRRGAEGHPAARRRRGWELQAGECGRKGACLADDHRLGRPAAARGWPWRVGGQWPAAAAGWRGFSPAPGAVRSASYRPRARTVLLALASAAHATRGRLLRPARMCAHMGTGGRRAVH
mmetsp:Transcript_11546/g.29883  ORF Transcript_11546/g.29883 Transcript_11546/m.29883 type:complete len:232 (-) Transcript_11546:30-725(-)